MRGARRARLMPLSAVAEVEHTACIVTLLYRCVELGGLRLVANLCKAQAYPLVSVRRCSFSCASILLTTPWPQVEPCFILLHHRKNIHRNRKNVRYIAFQQVVTQHIAQHVGARGLQDV